MRVLQVYSRIVRIYLFKYITFLHLDRNLHLIDIPLIFILFFFSKMQTLKLTLYLDANSYLEVNSTFKNQYSQAIEHLPYFAEIRNRSHKLLVSSLSISSLKKYHSYAVLGKVENIFQRHLIFFFIEDYYRNRLLSENVLIRQKK